MKAPVTRREMIKRFRKLGWESPYSGKRHQFMKKGAQKVRIPNPHGNAVISLPLLDEILKQAGIHRKEWESLST